MSRRRRRRREREGEGVIDGSMLEGGGQILRMTLALSTLLCKPVKFINIRAGRRRPGLRNQHLIGMRFVGRLCNASITGARVQAMTVSYEPEDVNLTEDVYEADAVTGGATALLLQVSLPCLIFAAVQATPDHPLLVRYLGGTNGDFAPTVDYFENVFVPMFASCFSCSFLSVNCLRRCFGFVGQDGRNGHIELTLSGHVEGTLPAMSLVDRGTVTRVHIVSIATGNVRAVTAERLCGATQAELVKRFGDDVEYVEDVRHEVGDRAIGSSVQVSVFLETSTGCRFGSVQKKSKRDRQERVVQKVVRSIVEDWDSLGCVDQYLQDQFIVFMALAEGCSTMRIGKKMTLHTRTAIHFAQVMTGCEFQVEDQEDGSKMVTVEGIGFQFQAE